RVAVAVLLRGFPQRGPGADIAPADIERYDGGAVGPLHHGVVDRAGRRSREGVLVEAQEIEVAHRQGHGLGGGRQHLRLQTFELRQVAGGAEQEYAAIPGVTAVGQIGLRRLEIRLLDESLYAEAAGAAVERLAAPDVAVARLRPVGRDAEGDECAAACGTGGPVHRLPKP